MNAAQWQRVRDLFERAFEQQPTNIAAWLEAEAGEDGEVRAEVASLLAHHSGVGSFMAQPVASRVSALLAEEPTLAPGQIVGPYTIRREVGRGGMGCVYLASDTRLGRTVALKALTPELVSDPNQRERLRREARAAAALTHVGICTVYALEEIDGQLFIATEFVTGDTLREEIKRDRRPSPLQALDTARQLASALACAHANGVVHRDLKPENVMRTREGRLKVLDFGLALMGPTEGERPATRVTQPGMIIGTPAYMAPEQLTGEPPDARADVFAFGVLLYEYITKTHPFCATTPLGLAARVLESDVVPVGRLAPQVPEGLATVIERCLQKRPDDRYTSAIEVEQALDRDVSLARGGRVATWWRTHHLVVIGLYALACVLGWQVKEWHQGWTNQIFVGLSILATIGGVLRSHLLFTHRVNETGLTAARHRAEPATWIIDLGMGGGLVADGVMLLPTREVAGVLVAALGVGLALVRVIVEPSTTAAAFTSDDK